jgi:hypothetical protein
MTGRDREREDIIIAKQNRAVRLALIWQRQFERAGFKIGWLADLKVIFAIADVDIEGLSHNAF